MCKQKGRAFCSELGADISLWSKDAPPPKPVWISATFQDFWDSLKLAIDGNLDGARSFLKDSPDLEMRAWFDLHAQNSGGWRYKDFGVTGPTPIFPLDEEGF